MKRSKRILIGFGCIALLMTSWFLTINAKSEEEKQAMLMEEAATLMKDGIFISAVPLLEEAASYSTLHTLAAETQLKKAYRELFNTHGFRSKYAGLLDKQLSRKDAEADVFAEAADYYMSIRRTSDALEILKDGIARTGSELLTDIYENNRYAYEVNRTRYDYAATIYNDTAQVQIDGYWGVAHSNGALMIPCQYELISTFSEERAIAKSGGEIIAIDSNNNRVAKLHQKAISFGNYSENRVPILFSEGWRRATGDFTIGAAVFEDIGMYSEGYAAAKDNGRWGVISLVSDWLVPAQYDDIIRDELGRSYAQGAVFTRLADTVFLYSNGVRREETFEDARPFSNEGFAAVMRNGKWGFIDTNGMLVIDFAYDDALSFGQHLAAVKLGEYWGYISKNGLIVVEPIFLEAKSFSNGSAPVRTQRGWDFITLIEYR